MTNKNDYKKQGDPAKSLMLVISIMSCLVLISFAVSVMMIYQVSQTPIVEQHCKEVK